ncbi:ppsB [Symbiodinium sp. CCMP2592]|nr:ppsB [Symbiodinium sp. CCMP2592]
MRKKASNTTTGMALFQSHGWLECHWPLPDGAFEASLTELFQRRCRAEPRATALRVPGTAEAWTRKDLAAAASRAAVALQRHLPIASGACVALGVDEGPAMVVLQLAVMEARHFFLPLDLRQPPGRLEVMLTSAGAGLLLAFAASLGSIYTPQGCLLVSAEEVLGAAPVSAKTPELGPAPDDLCYVQFTSGSTGKPKGVLCEHRQAAWYALSKAAAEGVDESSCLMLTAAFTFDPCQGDIFCALVSGAVLALVPRVRLLQDLTQVLRQSQASHLCATPALWRLVDDAELPHLRFLALGGEKMPPAMVRKWAPLLQLRNVYGVTEATVYQTAMQMTSETRPQTAGWPLPGVQVKIVGWEEAEEEEEAEEGEICLGGPGLARGYLGLPALTEERFRRLPGGGGRCYHTGDSGRWLASVGSHPCLEVLGRRDSQVKLNGERIELGEVEQLLGMSPVVTQCAAMPWGDQGNLLAFVVLAKGEALDGLAYLALMAHCDSHLPRIMRPRRLVALDTLPVTPNGKIDRRALIAPQLATEVDKDVEREPLSPLEEAIAAAWTSELSLKNHLGPGADFYLLGGGSVHAVRVTRLLRAVLHGGGGGKAKWAEGTSDWRNPAGDASLFLPPERAGDAECHFGLCDGGPFAPCALLERPVLRNYASFLAEAGVRVGKDPTTEAVDAVDAVESDPGANLPRALETALRSGREVLAHALLLAKASATGGLERRQRGTCPLHWAAQRCSGRVVGALLAFRAHVTQATEAGAVPAQVAAAAGNASALRALLENGTPACVRDASKQSLLHYAARSGSVDVIRLAVQHGAEVDCRDKQLRTALHWAALSGDAAVVAALLAAACDPQPPKVSASLHERRTRLAQESPLELAVSRHPANNELHSLLRAAEQEKMRASRSAKRILRVFKTEHFASADAVLLELKGQRCFRVAVLLPETDATSDAAVVLEERGPDQGTWVLQIEQLPLGSVLQIFEACAAPQSCQAFSAASEADDGASSAAALLLGRELLALQQQGLQPLAGSTEFSQLRATEPLRTKREFQILQGQDWAARYYPTARGEGVEGPGNAHGRNFRVTSLPSDCMQLEILWDLLGRKVTWKFLNAAEQEIQAGEKKAAAKRGAKARSEPRSKASNRGPYFLVGSWDNWKGFAEFLPFGDSFRTKVKVGLGMKRVEFQVVVARDWNRRFHPTSSGRVIAQRSESSGGGWIMNT